MLRRRLFADAGDRLRGSSRARTSKPLPEITRVDTGFINKKRMCRKRMNVLCIFTVVSGCQSCGDDDIMFTAKKLRGHDCMNAIAPSRGTGMTRLSQKRHERPYKSDPHPQNAMYSQIPWDPETMIDRPSLNHPAKGFLVPRVRLSHRICTIWPLQDDTEKAAPLLQACL